MHNYIVGREEAKEPNVRPVDTDHTGPVPGDLRQHGDRHRRAVGPRTEGLPPALQTHHTRHGRLRQVATRFQGSTHRGPNSFTKR